MTHEKISPRLLFALNSFRAHGESVLLKRIRTVGIVPALGRPKATRTVIFIHCHENADLGDLAALGVELNQPRGKVRTAILPLDAVEKVADHPAVQRVMASHTLRPLMDVALPALHVPAFRQSNSLSGKNVVIGTVDTGIDSNHPAFAGRILRIWDQTLSGPGVAEGGYGAELTGSLLSVSEDDEGHGTHVAGIAASGDAKYTGVAPDAVLVAVKTDFNTAHIADGVRYIFRIAKEMNLPAVVNLSLGGHSDAHDGTDSLSQLIDSESGPGRIVCCAAGNEGNDNIHAKRNLKPGQSLTMRFVVGSAQVDEVFLNGWYSGGAALEVSIRTPGGFTIPYQPVITSGSPARQYSLPDALLNIATPGPDPDNSDHNVLVSLDGPGRGFVRNGIWQLRLKNTSNKATDVHFWSMDDHEPTATVFTGRASTTPPKWDRQGPPHVRSQLPLSRRARVGPISTATWRPWLSRTTTFPTSAAKARCVMGRASPMSRRPAPSSFPAFRPGLPPRGHG